MIGSYWELLKRNTKPFSVSRNPDARVIAWLLVVPITGHFTRTVEGLNPADVYIGFCYMT
jgi:hypothetical protein